MPMLFRFLCDAPGCGVETELRDEQSMGEMPRGWSKLVRDGRQYHLCVRCTDRALTPPETD